MSILPAINKVLLVLYSLCLISSLSSISSPVIIDSKTGDVNVLIPCPIDRTKWTLPTILQWYRSKNNYTQPVASQFDDYPVHIDDLYRHQYSLLANGSLNIENVQLNDNDTFECRLILIDRGLLDIKDKHFITLRVNEKPRFVNLSNALQIASHYTTVNFLCQIYGVPVPVVTWYKILEKNKPAGGNNDLELLPDRTQQLTIPNVDDRAAGTYRCVGENRLGKVHSDFQLLICGSIYWRRFPQSQTVKLNDSLILNCEGESSEPLQYHWLKDDLPVSDLVALQERIRTYSDGVLSIQRIEPSDHGSYVCLISISKSVNVRSKPAIITVKYPPMPSRDRQTKNLTLIRGSPGICPCLLDAYPPIQSVAWYRNGISIRIESKNGAYAIQSDYSLMIKSVDAVDDGQYFCRAQNSEGFGRDSLPFYVETKEPIKFFLKPTSIYRVNEGDQLVVPCVAFGNPQPMIKWYKNSEELKEVNSNLTLESIDKVDHGLYVCQASNEHTTTNITTLIIVENTTPQAPHNVQYKQFGAHLHVSWETGYDGGRPQHFIIWHRLLHARKRNWHQIRVLPNNATEFTLFALKLQQTYELTVVAENDLGLGTFTPISTVELNHTETASADYLQYAHETNLSRPSSPRNLRLSQSRSNLYITWDHPNPIEAATWIVSYAIQWRSTIQFNNQQSQQSFVVQYPTRSFTIRDVKESKYIVQILSYSDKGTYSAPLESQIDIRFNSILAYNGSSRLLILLLCVLITLTIASICVCIFCIFKYYHYRRTYCTNLECDTKGRWCCFPPTRYKLGDCSHLKVDRYHASLLKSNDLASSPLYTNQKRILPQTNAACIRPPSPQDTYADSTISLAKVAAVPRCRNSIISNPLVGSILTFTASDENKTTSFVEPTPSNHVSSAPSADTDTRKNGARLALEVVPEMHELDVGNPRYTFEPTLPASHHPRAVQPSPILITFDSSSLKRRT